jgi:hypothetical protein
MKTLFEGQKSSLLILPAVIVLWLGCATYNKIETSEKKSGAEIAILQQQSAGQIPCPPEKIEITEYEINKSDGSGYWTAIGCDGGTYSCTRRSNDPQDINCEQADPNLIN